MKKLFFVALAATAMVACTNDEVVSIKGGDAIAFDEAFIDNATRAEDPSLTVDDLNSFKVWGTLKADNTDPVFVFYGTEVTKSGDAWTYGDTQYWVPGSQYEFFAVAPVSNNWGLTTDSTTQETSLSFTNVDGTEDLIGARESVSTVNEQPDKVDLTFNHLLSKVKFTFNTGFTSGQTSIVVENIKMTAPKKGSVNMARKWTLDNTAGTTTLAFGGTDKLATGQIDDCADERLTIPAGADYTYTITFDVVMKINGTTVKTFKEERTQLTGVALEAGKAYNFVAEVSPETLGMEPIVFNVEKIEAWVETTPVSTAAQALQNAINAAQNGDTIELSENITAYTALTIPADKEVTIDLKGKTIAGAISRDLKGVIKNEGTLNIVGGTVKSTATNSAAAIYNYGVMTLDGVTIEGAPSDTSTGGYASYAVSSTGAGSKLTVTNCNISGRGSIAATEGTKVTIDGGTYHSPAAVWGHAVYASDANTEVTINGGTFTEGWEYANDLWGMYQIYAGDGSVVTVNGGDFSQKWDCANGYDLAIGSTGSIVVKGGVFADNPSSQNGKNFVASGYSVVNNGNGTYSVWGEQVTLSGDDTAEATALRAALAAGKYATLTSRIVTNPDGNVGYKMNNGGVIDGDGNYIWMNGKTSTAVQIYGGTLIDLEFWQANKAIEVVASKSKVYLNNVTVSKDWNCNYALHCDSSNGHGLEATNCKFYGYISYAASIGDVKFTGCTFGVNKSDSTGLNPYGATEFVGCEFEAGTFVGTDNAACTFENCTLGGVALTATNIGDLVTNTSNATIL